MIVLIQISVHQIEFVQCPRKLFILYNIVFMEEILYTSNNWHTNEVSEYNNTFARYELPVYD